jgi:hypothetical protein
MNIVDELATLYGRGESHGLRSGIDTRSARSFPPDLDDRARRHGAGPGGRPTLIRVAGLRDHGPVTHTPRRTASAPESTRRTRADAPRRLLIGAFIVCAVSVIASLLPSTGWWVNAKIIIAVGLWAGWLASSIMSLRRGFLPARFDVREGRSFTAPVSRRRGLQITSIMFAGAVSAIVIESWINDSAGIGRSASVRYWSLGLVAVFIALILINVIPTLRGRPGVDLTPETLAYRQPLGDLIIPWPALAGEVTVTITRPDLQSSVVPTVARPDLVRRRGLASTTFRIQVVLQQIDPFFLAAAIRFYVQNPDRRAQIGTLAEHEHQLADLGLS